MANTNTPKNARIIPGILNPKMVLPKNIFARNPPKNAPAKLKITVETMPLRFPSMLNICAIYATINPITVHVNVLKRNSFIL